MDRQLVENLMLFLATAPPKKAATKAYCLNWLPIVANLVGLVMLGCSDASNRESVAVGAGALKIQMQVSFPAGFDESNVVLHGTHGLDIGNHVLIDAEGGSLPASLNMGSETLHSGHGATTGTLLSGGAITLGHHSLVQGDLQAAQRIVLEHGVTVTGEQRPNTPLGSFTALTFTADFPDAMQGFGVARHQAATLAPGAYTNVAALTHSVLKLRTGKYFADRLVVDKHSVLELDVTNGPILMYVKESLKYEGEVAGPADHFFLAYLGAANVSINSPFNGTIVAPSGTLELARVPDPGHRGSFFAKSLQVADAPDAGLQGPSRTGPSGQSDSQRPTKITHDPFDFWFEVLDLHPTLQCVRRFKSPQGAALFGYVNESDFAVAVPLGPSNRLEPEVDAASPILMEPGVHPTQFWVPFDLRGTVTWHLTGESVTASGASTPCQLGDVRPEDEPGPQPTVVAIETPSVSFDSVSSQIAPDVTSRGFSYPPASSHVTQPLLASKAKRLRTGLQALTNSEAGFASFTFTVTSLNFRDREGLFGRVDPFVHELIVDGTNLGSSNSGTVQVARDRRTLHVTVDVDDDDGFLRGRDDNLWTYEIDVDLYAGANTCTEDGRMCYTATATASPDLCFDWNAQFVDAGPWAGGIASEDFLDGKALQSVPASFACYKVRMVNSSGVIHDDKGVLDKNGCVPGPKLPIREHWALDTDLKVTLSLISQIYLDPGGTDCPQSEEGHTGANVTIRQSDQTGAAEICAIFAEDPGSVTEPNCIARHIDWTDMPPSPLNPNFNDHNSVTRASAVIGHIFRKEVETAGGLGIENAMIHRRFEGKGTVDVIVDNFCDVPDGCSNTVRHTSCRIGNQIKLQPDADGLLSSTRFKYIVAHEFGHLIQGNGMGLMGLNYGCGAGEPNQPALCTCAHVPADQQLHCLQSLEEPNAAQIEGFAQYFAAKVFNRDLESDCAFVYYKPFLGLSCNPGAASCAPDPTSDLFVNQPPIPLSCRETKRWRNTHCLDAASSSDLLTFGTEYDWLEFLYGINNVSDATERWTTEDIFLAYRAACGSGAELARCTGRRVSWAGGTGHFSLKDGAQALSAPPFNLKTPQAASTFRTLGDDFGISDKP